MSCYLPLIIMIVSVFDSRPYSVHPDCGILAVNESLQVEVKFKPNTVGDHSEDLVISYDTGQQKPSTILMKVSLYS